MDISLLYDHVLEASAQSGLSVTEILGLARSFGILGVDCSLDHARGCEEEFSAMLTGAGLLAAEVHGPPELELVDVALRMGSARIVAAPFPDGSGQEPMAAEALEALDALADRAAEAGIAVAVDSRLSALLEARPGLRACFDTGGPVLGAFDAVEALDRLKGRIVHVRCRDFSQDPPGAELHPAPLGSGRARLGPIIEQLESSGYRGWYAIEHPGSSDQLGFMERSARWLQSLGPKG